MRSCPNCGRLTARTVDWACQWCGYPLLSKGYKKIDKTYKELQEERKQQELIAEPEPVLESEPEPEPEAKVRREPVAEPEPVLEYEPEPEAKVRREPVAEPEPVLESEPEPEQELVITPGGIIEVNAKTLISAFKADKAAANAKFTDRVLSITGVVDKVVVRDHLEIRYIILTGAEAAGLWNVRCTFGKEHSSELLRLAPRQAVTVQGKYDGYEKNILIKDCVLVR